MSAGRDPRVVEISGGDGLDDAADEAAAALQAGRLVVFPTETVYGIAGLAADAGATARIFAAKLRPAGLALPVMAATPDEALLLGAAGAEARALASSFWPGPITLVLRR